jgi:hypothetical protein
LVGIDVAKAQLDVAIGPNGESFLGLRAYGRVPGRARLGFIRRLGAELPGRFMCAPARARRFARGCRRGDQGGVHLHSLASAITCAAQTADGLHPAKGLLDALANPLTDLVARMTHRANVDRRVTCARLAGHVPSDCKSRSARPPAKRSPVAPSGRSRSRPRAGAQGSFGADLG